jgi:DNA helicase-2/ATP-dependent DNA helicase PcrA
VDYTPRQREAIASRDRPLQIIACAGSGKTQVISARIAGLIADGVARPSEIVAFTFTEKAAAELQDRIMSEVEAATGTIHGLAEMYIGTMHGYALDILQTYVPASFKYRVLDEVQSRLFIDRNSRRSGLTTCPTNSPGTPTLRRYIHSRLYLQAMSVLREDNVDYSHVPSGVTDSLHAYRKLLHENAYFDYTEILRSAVDLLDDTSGDPRLELLHARIRELRFVVVDEYQDVNPVQERLVAALTRDGANLCVVGDDDQTIYQWRGSEVANILSFRSRHPHTHPVYLDDNFRSSPGIVQVGRSVAERIPTGERLDKNMEASGHQHFERGDLLALEFTSPEEEAAWIADRIETMRGLPFTDDPDHLPRGLSWSDFSVLFRSVANDADALAAEFHRRGIPFIVKGLNRLFDAVEVQAVVAVFAYMVGRVDPEELETAWSDADLIPADGDFGAAIRVLDEGRDFDRGQRWGVYNIQRLYLKFLEELGLREETLPGGPERAELVFYQLGKFSQVISDYEEINFSSTPYEKYTGFDNWLRYQAPAYYAESDEDIGYARPDAVSVSTVHQAKGMQWPVVFIPCLRRNRFPSKRHGGLGLFHVIPDEALADPDRYRGTVEDETRLMYVAVTRAQKWLFGSYSPGNRPYTGRSPFFDHLTRSPWVMTRDPGIRTPTGERLPPKAKTETPAVSLSFSELKYLFECPYQFKLRFLCGFNPPIHEALGYGKGLHDALAEVHKRALTGDIVSRADAKALVQRHLHTPFAYPALRNALEEAAVDAVDRYLRDQGSTLPRTLYSEKQIQVHVAPGITVDGRIDLIRRLDTDETSIVDFKSSARAQEEDVTFDQLHVYALGYHELTGEHADLVEILNLDPQAKSEQDLVDEKMLEDVRSRISTAGDALRSGELPKHINWCGSCERCDLVALCRARPE